MTTWKTLPDMSWLVRAACRADNGCKVPPEWFGLLDYRPVGPAEREPTVRAALAVCARCTVIAECRRQSDAEGRNATGVWAGRYLGTYEER